MDKAERAKLLRSRFKAVGGKPRAIEAPSKAEAPKPRGWFTFGLWGGDMAEPKLNDWVQIPDEKPPLTVKTERRRKGDTALTKIAAKWRRFS
jgi:hypothetical protein